MTQPAQPGGSPDPFDELRKLLAPDACRELVAALFLIRGKQKYGEILIKLANDSTELECTYTLQIKK